MSGVRRAGRVVHLLRLLGCSDRSSTTSRASPAGYICFRQDCERRGGSGWVSAALGAAAMLSLYAGSIAPSDPAFCDESGKFLINDSYRRRVFFKYERRIRAFSPPEKVFEYFATIRDNGQCYMSPTDLMRAVVAVFPPSDSSYVREGSLAGERAVGDLRCFPSRFFMLFDTNGDDKISFPEYIFFITLLSVPEEDFSATFKMFDIDGNGMIDREEFKKIMEVMRTQTRQGAAQREGRRSVLFKNVSSVDNAGLVQWFFGEDGSKLLNYDEFVSFLRQLHEEMVKLEFSHYDFEQSGSISARDFALSLVAAADLSKINQYLDMSDSLADEPAFKNVRISYEDFSHFAALRKKLPTLALAMSSFGKTYGLLAKADLQRAAAQVCGVPLSDTVADIVFYIFDINRDGSLSMEEFLGALQRREQDIAHPSETGIVQFFKCWWKCAKNCQSGKHWTPV